MKANSVWTKLISILWSIWHVFEKVGGNWQTRTNPMETPEEDMKPQSDTNHEY